jgi:hypothetical protein
MDSELSPENATNKLGKLSTSLRETPDRAIAFRLSEASPVSKWNAGAEAANLDSHRFVLKLLHGGSRTNKARAISARLHKLICTFEGNVM